MIGAIAGDVIGSVHEYTATKTKDFPLIDPRCFFTDDTVLTIALADALLHELDYAVTLKLYYRRYPDAGYGSAFHDWAMSDSWAPYNSWGNGAAMRVSPAAYVAESLDEAMALAERSAAVTHNHPEGVRGAQATAAAIFLARAGHKKSEIKRFIEASFGYDLQQHWMKYGPHMCSTSLARKRYRKPLRHSWRQTTSKTPFATPFHSAETPIR